MTEYIIFSTLQNKGVTMYSAYFLACALNILLGYFLYTKQDQNDPNQEADQEKTKILQTNLFHNRWNLIIITGLTALTAIAKIIAPTNGKSYFFGDLIPAVSLGVIAVVCILRISTFSGSSNTVQQEHRLLGYSKYIGLIAMIAGIAHVFLHNVLFL